MYSTRFPVLFALLIVLTLSCKEATNAPETEVRSKAEVIAYPERNLSQDFKDYWYEGTAEITSFALTQERYGELREGHAVQVFVTEDLLPEKQVKADRSGEANIPVLKLNATKKFLTGIYPYSIMTSTFSPVNFKSHALKVSHSAQEWCGHVYMQLNNKEEFLVGSHSYFEQEADQQVRLKKTWLEDELWSIIRMDPGELPTGEISVIPAFEFLRLRHKPISAYDANASLKKRDSVSIYHLEFPTLQRDLKIFFSTKFPFTVEQWDETIGSGSSAGLRTTAKKVKRLQTAYWSKNRNEHSFLRDSLRLPNNTGIKYQTTE